MITVSEAVPVVDELAVLVAVMVWAPRANGAVYLPLDVIVPIEELPPEIPSTDHVTATVVVNC